MVGQKCWLPQAGWGRVTFGLSSTPRGKLNTLDILHQPLPLRKGKLALGAGRRLGALGRGRDRGRQERAVCVMNVHLCSRGCFRDGTPACVTVGTSPSVSVRHHSPGRVSASSCVAQDISAEPGSGWPEQIQNYSCFGTWGGGPLA